MIRAEHLTKRYADGKGRSLTVLQDASFEIQPGKMVALVGPSGAGKSSLLHILGGLDTDFEGDVQVLGEKMRGLPDAKRAALRNQRIGFVFQSYHLIPNLRAWENVALPASFSPHEVPDAPERARAALGRVGLANKVDAMPTELSGGERQRVAIARALFFAPPLLLCDEPTGNLDARTGAEVVELFRSLSTKDQVTLLIATHEEKVASAASQLFRLESGALKEEAR